ncbi:helix-turn-helix domain-containing protein, partial [Pseudomonas aeruginosa]
GAGTSTMWIRDSQSKTRGVGALRRELAQQERNLIEAALRQARGNLSRAAARLRIPRTTLLGRMRRLGLPASLDPPA